MLSYHVALQSSSQLQSSVGRCSSLESSKPHIYFTSRYNSRLKDFDIPLVSFFFYLIRFSFTYLLLETEWWMGDIIFLFNLLMPQKQELRQEQIKINLNLFNIQYILISVFDSVKIRDQWMEEIYKLDFILNTN